MNCRLFITLLLLSVSSLATAINMPLTDLDGKPGNINQYLGKWVVVNYWATWCPPCIIEMPELQAFHDAHAERDAVVVGISLEYINVERLRSFLDDLFITYPVYSSKPLRESELGVIPGLPTTFLVDPEGKVVARQVGPVTQDLLEQFISIRSAE